MKHYVAGVLIENNTITSKKNKWFLYKKKLSKHFHLLFYDIILLNSTAIYPPTVALFLIKHTFDRDDSPSVNSFILLSKNGVIYAPVICY